MGIKERQDRERQAVREAILDAARDLFVSEGYRNVSIRKIAERIDTAPPPSTATSPARTTSSLRWPKKASAGSTPRSAALPGTTIRSKTCGRAGGRTTSSPRASRVLRADVRRSIGAADHRAMDRAGVRARDARVRGRAHSALHRRRHLCAAAPTRWSRCTSIWGALTGPAVIGSGCRLAPGEDPDALARDVLELSSRASRPAAVRRLSRVHPHPLTVLARRTHRPVGVRSHDA